MFSSIAILAVIASQVSAYSLCNTATYVYQGKNVTVPILSTATKTIMVGGAPVSVTVAGSITVVDGCSFFLSNDFSFSGPQQATFFGGQTPSDTNAVRLIAETIPAPKTPGNGTYTFIKTAGSFVSYADFNEFRLYDPVSQSVIGVATLPGNGNTASTSNSNTTPASGTVPAPTSSKLPAATAAANGASAVTLGGLTLVGSAMMML